MSRYFRLRSEHCRAKNELSVSGSFFNHFVASELWAPPRSGHSGYEHLEIKTSLSYVQLRVFNKVIYIIVNLFLRVAGSPIYFSTLISKFEIETSVKLAAKTAANSSTMKHSIIYRPKVEGRFPLLKIYLTCGISLHSIF